ncbi:MULTISPECIES: MucR family transcriptional regulator [unclassified Mesorhizobium]|uniref:MucR family transcriptional regulator n=1 Tax=unclassified Mesorhizobium TaxID=325217 RepID=UPI000FCCB1AE|nr:MULTISPECIES: MucR family transcriptional regulator [unclassified Mesorhizobium]RUU82828.1 transcriptional regulator [Mesorhizobium sp. M7A.F.Ca.MR.362.00.0.0]RUV21050.1 transcriptional regulator [Mesorhizobium sp. M7A.F.Ca.MR.245.00.0.0]RUV51193.1 transcriptional regulator [Mesorhizobium sp. M7A.F.Ca.MR.228.00.0.0]RWN96440.1 MAG: transcriptional regulator [Mesorhizobium sp.]
MTDEIERNTALIELTADIVAAFVQNNAVTVAGLPDLISSVNAALSKLGPTPVAELPTLTPAVNPKKSIFPDYIISLEDGRKFKSMKRHLGLLGMTPEQYRTKWGLPRDYPMVAPSYAAQRSKLAKSIGLGLKPATKDPAKKAPAKKPAPKGIKAKGAKRNLTRNA